MYNVHTSTHIVHRTAVWLYWTRKLFLSTENNECFSLLIWYDNDDGGTVPHRNKPTKVFLINRVIFLFRFYFIQFLLCWHITVVLLKIFKIEKKSEKNNLKRMSIKPIISFISQIMKYVFHCISVKLCSYST